MEKEQILAKGRGPTRGEREQMSSFRPEVTCLYSALFLTNKQGKKLGKQIKVDAWTDNLALVRGVKKICQNNPPILY